ncbi:MAG: hypothetical protein JWO62_1864 [Acidimicrobiaceae bacterium]|nr:hypothetical protein [Acidimicrobiaceae bacterium]
MFECPRRRVFTLAVASAAVVSLLSSAGARIAEQSSAAEPPNAAVLAAQSTGSSSAVGCDLGNGVKHVVEITFDNVHFFRDNPNVPSDLEMMPHLLDFIEQHGTMLSNNHTPLIAHTANDTLTTYTGLYGDRQGMPISNTYQSYNADGTTDPAGSFAYWTDAVYDTATTPNAGRDTNPSMIYSATPPATSAVAPNPSQVTPAPWVPYTRAGCDVGDVSVANMDLENTAVDVPKVFGATSPEAQQLAADTDPYKDPETADYVGLSVHCAKSSEFCSTARAVKYDESPASPTAVDDLLASEPGGYTGFQALFGHRYIAPQLGAGTANVTHNGYQVTNAGGNLVDLNGNEINGAYVSNHPGFPGFGSINASQSLAYTADMLESGVPVVYSYISDVHGNERIPALSSACAAAPAALGSGSPCYVAQAQYYDQAFESFLNRLAADGITPANTLFVVSSDEGDHEAGANVGRAIQPTPVNCDGATVTGTVVTPDVACTYPKGSFGELDANVTGLLATQKNDKTPFSLESDTAPQFYVTGNPSPGSTSVRTLEHDVAGLTAANPYSGNTNELITNYLADPTEEAILHMVNADPARTPTFSMFAKPDYYLSTGSSSCANVTGPSSSDCVDQSAGYAWDHGDYAAEIDTDYLGLVGPGVANLGLDGSPANAGPSSAGPLSGQTTVPQSGTTGTWIDETDVRPTVMYLSGLKDDYTEDGRVITQVLSNKAPKDLSSPEVEKLGACYKQLNSSVGEFGTATLEASTNAIESSSAGDSLYTTVDQKLAGLDRTRDRLAAQIKDELFRAEFDGGVVTNPPRADAGL